MELLWLGFAFFACAIVALLLMPAWEVLASLIEAIIDGIFDVVEKIFGCRDKF